MSESNEQLNMARLRAIPLRVKYAFYTSALLGIVMMLRILFLTSIPLNKCWWFLGLIFFNFVFNGFSLIGRSRSSYR